MTELEAALLQNADQQRRLAEQQKSIAELEEELTVMARKTRGSRSQARRSLRTTRRRMG